MASNSQFTDEFTKLINSNLNENDYKQLCISGGLRTSSFRSVIWRVLMKCLPIDRQEWGTILPRSRKKYEYLKLKNIPNPRDSSFPQDAQINNPLAESDQCSWSRYFMDTNLRDIIYKDVMRTFPEIQFFQEPHIRKIMSNILHVYAKENPFISYKQGMHEILAPLLFVIYSDIQAFSDAKERKEISSLAPSDQSTLGILNDPKYIEHDTYALFCEVMMEASPWYEEGSNEQDSTDHPQPFTFQDFVTSPLLSELKAIGKTLDDFDPELQQHLMDFEIVPQLYGIRCLRLLFGRDFPIHDLLFLWDVIFSDRPIPRIVECIFVAMLVQIRDLLIRADYSECLKYLMNYPPVADIASFVQLALHFRAPTKNPRPKQQLPNYSHLTVQGTSHPNKKFDPNLDMLNRVHKERISSSKSVESSPQKGKKLPVLPKEIEQQMSVLEEQVNTLQRILDQRDILSNWAIDVLFAAIEDLPDAENVDERHALSKRISQVVTRLRKGSVDQRSMSFGGHGLKRGSNAMPGGLARELAADPFEFSKKSSRKLAAPETSGVSRLPLNM